MHIQHAFHVNKHFLKTKKSHVVLSMTLRQFAVTTSAIFVPLFLFDIGYSMQQVVLFFIAVQLMRAAMFYPAMQMVKRFGVHHTITISYFLAAIYMLSLYTAQFSQAGIWIALLFGPAMEVFYWGSSHIDIATVSSRKKMTKNVGLITSLQLLSMGVAPIVGGIVAATAGPGYTLLLSFGILILAAAAIHSEISEERHIIPHKFRLVKPSRELVRAMVGSFADNYTGWVANMIWPIYVFLLLGGFDTLGYIIGGGYVLGVIMIQLLQRFNDSHPSIFKFGIVYKSVMFPLRFLSTTQLGVIVANGLYSLVFPFYGVPYLSWYHKNAKHDPVNYVFWVEVAGEIGKAMCWLTFFVLLLLMSDLEAARYTLLFATPVVYLGWLVIPKKTRT